MLKNNVYELKLRYVFKYIGYDRKALDTFLDKVLTGGSHNKYYQIINDIDPFHIVRFKYTQETPIAYTYSSSKENASKKFLDVLKPLVEAQDSKDIVKQYNKDNFISMVINNTRVSSNITWDSDYNQMSEYSQKETLTEIKDYEDSYINNY